MHSIFREKIKISNHKTVVCLKKITPGEVLNTVAEGINTGDLDSLMTLYEADETDERIIVKNKCYLLLFHQ